MLDILKNFEDASAGKKPAAGAASTNEMKAILESFNKVEECGMEEMPMQAPMSSEGQPVTVNITASGKDNVADLISMMQQAAGIMQAGPAVVADEPQQDMDMAKMKAAIMPTEEEDEDVDEWENSPQDTDGDPEYDDHMTMIKDLSGGINREKKAYKATQDGDNPMALEASIKEQLLAALEEKKCGSKRMKAKEGKYKNDAQRKAVHAAKSKKNESDVDEAHGNSKVYDKCWDGYEKVPGKKRGEPGSCRKK